ncbi:MAG: hypothetical protein MUE93_06500 [Ignavibacteriaceae bacterium]|nr:hypothetical protein [Ignavibacteriaceae bacterium]
MNGETGSERIIKQKKKFGWSFTIKILVNPDYLTMMQLKRRYASAGLIV